jgi:hypothetical protein
MYKMIKHPPIMAKGTQKLIFNQADPESAAESVSAMEKITRLHTSTRDGSMSKGQEHSKWSPLEPTDGSGRLVSGSAL